MSQNSLQQRPLLAVGLVAVFASIADAQSFQGIGDLAGGLTESAAYNVSADGSTVVGSGRSALGREAVRWRSGALISLGGIAGGTVESYASGTNFDGSIIVGLAHDASVNRPVRWDGLVITQLPQAPNFGGGGVARSISANGRTIIGYDTDGDLSSWNNATAYRIDDGVLTALIYQGPSGKDSAANGSPSADGRVLTGRVRLISGVLRACTWTDSTFAELPNLVGGPDYSQGTNVSADGTVIVGTCGSAASNQAEACRWVGGLPFSLGNLPGGINSGAADACNHDGSLIVGYSDVAGAWHAFIWDATNGMRDLKSVLTNDHGLNLSGWTLTEATGITPDGSVIVGYGTNPNGDTEGFVARISCTTVVSHCVAKTNSLGCLPSISATGIPSATANSGFVVQSANMRNKKAGMLLYGVNGAASVPFQGGTLCLAAPVKRSNALNSGGSPTGADCSGVYSIDFNSFARGLLGGTPLAALSLPGTTVDCQFWGRDPGFSAPNDTQLSNGLRFLICN